MLEVFKICVDRRPEILRIQVKSMFNKAYGEFKFALFEILIDQLKLDIIIHSQELAC